MIPKEFRDIVLGLIEKSKNNQVNWKLARDVMSDTEAGIGISL
ncbi:MAG: hypothetical protein ABSE06_13735 [Anaerolineaceae bacterium]|jgi:hypothetical protein